MDDEANARAVAPTVGGLVRAVAARVAAAGVGDTPRLDAELIIGAVTGLDRVALRVRDGDSVPTAHVDAVESLTARRERGEPVAYLLGEAWFAGLAFEVGPDVLIPRPETELLVDHALASLPATGGTIVDACTGSGCVAIAVAAARRGVGTVVHATDISPHALDVARRNARRHGVDVTFHEGDLLEPLAGAVAPGAIDVVVANPPYVTPDDAHLVESGVHAFEPHVALYVPGDGRIEGIIGRLAAAASSLLARGGALAVEHGAGQRAAVSAAFERAGLVDVTGVDDLAGIDRVVVGRRPR